MTDPTASGIFFCEEHGRSFQPLQRGRRPDGWSCCSWAHPEPCNWTELLVPPQPEPEPEEWDAELVNAVRKAFSYAPDVPGLIRMHLDALRDEGYEVVKERAREALGLDT